MSFLFNPNIPACPVKSLKTTKLTLADPDIDFVQDLPHFPFRNAEILCNLKAHGAGNFSVFGLFFNSLFYFLAIHNELHLISPLNQWIPPDMG